MQTIKICSDDDFEYEFTVEDIKTFEERTEKRLSGESNTYTWQEAKDIISNRAIM